MNEQNNKNIGLFDNDPFPKDVWEIAYKNTGGKPFEKESSFSQADEKTENATQSPKSTISFEQQRLKSELKAKQEQRQTSTQVRNSTTNYSTTIITDTADRKTSTNAYSAPSSYKPDNEEHDEIDSLEDLITKLLKKPFKEIEKALAGEDFDKPTVAIAVAVAVFAIIIFGLLGS